MITIFETVQDLLLHGNHVDGAIAWDPAIAAREFLPSLYRARKPAFFGDQPWPATGADLAPNDSPIPAQRRYDGQH